MSSHYLYEILKNCGISNLSAGEKEQFCLFQGEN